jgi:Rho-binding antiterminator
MQNTYKPIDRSFFSMLAQLVKEKQYTRIQYYSDINEFVSVRALIIQLVYKDDEEFLQLADGNEIRLDRLVRVGTFAAPGYDEEYFKCDL